MCGIAGVIGGGADVRAAAARLAHRGPDGEGFLGDVLGFRRLAIIDLKTGAQPMKGCGDQWLVFNGEIYNYRELRARLAGHAFRTESDSEAILHLYEEKGPECVRELDDLTVFAELACRLFDRVFLFWQRSSGIEILDEAPAPPAGDPVCQVCGSAIPGDVRVFCRRCKTPHHKECWQFNGRCSTYACGEPKFSTRY